MNKLNALAWTDPYNLADEICSFLFFVRVVDNEGYELRYLGKTTAGKAILVEYARDIARISAGLPKLDTPGSEAYCAVHLALANACQHEWKYEFYPLEAVDPHRMIEIEQQRIRELQCNLNGARNWHMEDFSTISVSDLIDKDAPLSNGHLKDEWTGAQVTAARAVAQRDAESLLGQLLFAYAKLESDLDLCLVWVNEGRDLEERTAKIEKFNFFRKLEMLANDADRATCSGGVRAYGDWLADAHTVRKRRNVLVHGRLSIDVRYNGLTVTVSRATSESISTLHVGLSDLRRLIDECKRLVRTLNDLRASYPL